MTTQAPNPDLAAGEIRGRVAKLVSERLARKLGFKWGSGGLGDSLRGFVGNLSPAAVDAFGVGAAAFLQSPRGLAEWISHRTTFDVNKVDEVLNEAVDSAVSGFTDAAATKKGAATEVDYAAAVDRAIKKLEEEKKFADLDPLQRRVVADGANHIFHALDCPIVWKSQTRQKGGKGKDDKTETKTTYKDGHKEVTLKWALENDYVPTNGNCCCKAAKAAADEVLKSPKDVFACVDSLKDSMDEAEKGVRQKFYRLLSVATPHQRARLQAVGGDKRWQPSEIIMLLTLAADMEAFLGMLESKIKQPQKTLPEQGLDWVKRNWRALVGLQPTQDPAPAQPAPAAGAAAQPPAGEEPPAPQGNEVDAIRQAVDRFTQDMRAKTLADADRIRRKRAVWRR